MRRDHASRLVSRRRRLAVRHLRLSRALDELEVLLRDLKETEPEHVAPALLVLDERQLVDQRSDRGVHALDEFDVPAPGHKPRLHFDLVDLVVGHPAERSERLQWLSLAQARFRGIEDQPVTCGQALEARRLAVPSLGEAALDTT